MSAQSPTVANRDWPWHLQYQSEDTPNKLLARILKSDRQLHCSNSSWACKDKRHHGSKIMYWHRQACIIRKGQKVRETFLGHLEKQAIFGEKKKMERLREEYLWAQRECYREKAQRDAQERRAWEARQEAWRTHILAAWNAHLENERKEAARRAAEAEEEREREMRKRAAAVDALRAATAVARPLKMQRNPHGHAIHMPR
jgi:hypothetical protein